MSQHLPPPSFEKKIVPFEELEEFVSKLPHPIVLTAKDRTVRLIRKTTEPLSLPHWKVLPVL